MYFIKTYFKSQGHLKFKVKGTEYQGQMKGNKFSVCCKWLCDLCVTQMVRLRLKGILVFYSIGKNQAASLAFKLRIQTQ